MKNCTLTLLLIIFSISTFCNEPFIFQSTYKNSLINSASLPNKIKNAHIVHFKYGGVISNFDYRNSDGDKLSNLQGSVNNHISAGWKMHFKTSKLYILSGLSYNKYGAKGSDQSLGNYYDYNVNYVGIRVGLGYEFFKTKSYYNFPYVSSNNGITFNVQVSVASDFLINGIQTINNMVYNLAGVEQFDKPFIFIYGSMGVNYYVTKALSINLQYNGGRSFSVFKSNTNDNESLNYITHTFSLGLSISLPLY